MVRVRRWEPWLLVGPGLALYLVFGLGPILMAVLGSVVEMGYYGRGWIGFSAFKDVLTSPRFWRSVWITLKFTLVLFPSTMVLIAVISIVLSWAGNKLQAVVRMAFYVPSVISGVMISLAWRWIVMPGGPLSRISGDILWLGSNPYAFWTISVMVLSVSIGGSMVYLMAAFVAVDSQLYEAARLDGCNKAQEAWYITIPLVVPVITFVGVTRLVGLLQIWEFPYAMTGGGPNYATTPIMLLIYQEAEVVGNVTRASVMSLFLLVLVATILLVYRLVSGRRLLF